MNATKATKATNATDRRHHASNVVPLTPRQGGAGRRPAMTEPISLAHRRPAAHLVLAPPAASGAVSAADPIDRMLLTTDGTVTTLLEACTGEAIVTEMVGQSGPASARALASLPDGWAGPDHDVLAVEPVERLVARRVVLRGGRSGVAYVAAVALVVPGRLPRSVARRLGEPGASLGRLLAAAGHETRRHVLQIETAPAGAAGEQLGVAPDRVLTRRTYVIVLGARPVATVTEWLVPGRLMATVAERAGDPGRRLAHHVTDV